MGPRRFDSAAGGKPPSERTCTSRFLNFNLHTSSGGFALVPEVCEVLTSYGEKLGKTGGAQDRRSEAAPGFLGRAYRAVCDDWAYDIGAGVG
jgi:hypothetical protein